MSRTAQDVLEFDKLRELLRQQDDVRAGEEDGGGVGVFARRGVFAGRSLR